jgi:ribosomal protein S18 acetylase RimI-like enzyme
MSELIETPSLLLKWIRAPWDEAVCPFPVIQIDQIKVRGDGAREDMRAFADARARIGAGLVSCRLPHDKLAESMLLEACGFRFIEMLYAPHLDLAAVDATMQQDELTIARATEADMPALLRIAGSAFQNERFKVDPRLDPAISDRRFQNWVASTASHPVQQLYVISDHGRLIAFFIVELQADGTCYWHLNAVAPDAQGQGYGRRVWSGMLLHAKRSGAQQVRTSVVARNTRVLSLYARLGFTLPAPAMTFHWVKE